MHPKYPDLEQTSRLPPHLARAQLPGFITYDITSPPCDETYNQEPRRWLSLGVLEEPVFRDKKLRCDLVSLSFTLNWNNSSLRRFVILPFSSLTISLTSGISKNSAGILPWKSRNCLSWFLCLAALVQPAAFCRPTLLFPPSSSSCTIHSKSCKSTVQTERLLSGFIFFLNDLSQGQFNRTCRCKIPRC